MNTLIIFTAQYAYLLSIALFGGYFLITNRKKEFLIISLFVLPISYLFSLLVGHVFYDPRPFVMLHITPLISHAPDNGFPSDHALLTGTLAAIVTIFSIPTGIVLWTVAFLVGMARVLAQVHHTIDILGSFIIATVSTLAVWLVHSGNRRAL